MIKFPCFFCHTTIHKLSFMKKRHFDDVLDYGLFNEDKNEIPTSQIPTDVSWERYKFFTKVKTQNGETLVFRSPYSSMRPCEKDIGFLNWKRIMDGRFPLSSGGWIIIVENGFLSKWLRIESYHDKSQNLEFKVETVFPYGIQTGNPVFVNGNPAPDGKYKKSIFSSIYVLGGKVV